MGDLRPTLWKVWTPLALASNIRACLPSVLPSFFSPQGTSLVIVCLPHSPQRHRYFSLHLSRQSPHTKTAAGVPVLVPVEALALIKHAAPISCYPWLSSGPCAFLCVGLSQAQHLNWPARHTLCLLFRSMDHVGLSLSGCLFFSCFWSVLLTGLEDPCGQKLHLPCSLLYLQNSTVSLSL